MFVVASLDNRMSCTSFRVSVALIYFLESSYQEYISIFFEVGILNLVYGCIFGFQCVVDRFQVSVTLTYYLVSRIIVSGSKCQ